MGQPLLEPADIPVDSSQVDGPIIDFSSSVIGNHSDWWDTAILDARMTCVSMGNPHAIFYCGGVVNFAQ